MIFIFFPLEKGSVLKVKDFCLFKSILEILQQKLCALFFSNLLIGFPSWITSLTVKTTCQHKTATDGFSHHSFLEIERQKPKFLMVTIDTTRGSEEHASSDMIRVWSCCVACDPSPRIASLGDRHCNFQVRLLCKSCFFLCKKRILVTSSYPSPLVLVFFYFGSAFSTIENKRLCFCYSLVRSFGWWDKPPWNFTNMLKLTKLNVNYHQKHRLNSTFFQ